MNNLNPILEVLFGSIIVAWTIHSLLLVWFQGSIFAKYRGKLEALSDEFWWAKLFTCSLCMTVHIAFWLVALFVLPIYLIYAKDMREMFLMPLWVGGGIFLARLIDRYWTVNPAEE